MLKEFGSTIELIEGWPRSVLKSLNWSKRRATTGKLEPSAQLLTEVKFTFQKAIAKAIQDDDTPPDLLINLDQTPLCYVSTGKYTFHFKGSKHVPVKGVDDKQKITATFGEYSWRVSTNASHLWGKNEMKFAENQLPRIIFGVVHGKPLVQYLKIRGVFHGYCIPRLGKS